MEKKYGKKIFNGIAIGRIRFYAKTENRVSRTEIQDVEKEIARYHEAREEASAQLEKLYEKALAEVGEANAEIFNVHIMMLEDDDYNESVENIITTQRVNAEYAVLRKCLPIWMMNILRPVPLISVILQREWYQFCAAAAETVILVMSRLLS